MPRCHAQARARTPHTPPDKPRKTLHKPPSRFMLNVQDRAYRPPPGYEVAAGGAPAPAKYYLGSASGRCPPSPP
eukprot:CAMPEP_0202773536 /NCGR_PEP_ID=MMETSP1388-20130828/44816_1 /ASSEMBLY_ACC=CAM_ASM_000864 /TAXON_ID=37098 /ORGANISM="Isochrysis sp, Strain CCMP1244" /LENGTH=73 /DNA_ID=CAMNT_0049442555 /DNA_START=45 /DNA_END=263 /DNA_ORIENTATION=+